MIAVRWCLRYALSYRDVEKLLAERGIEVDHVTVYRSLIGRGLRVDPKSRPGRTRWWPCLLSIELVAPERQSER